MLFWEDMSEREREWVKIWLLEKGTIASSTSLLTQREEERTHGRNRTLGFYLGFPLEQTGLWSIAGYPCSSCRWGLLQWWNIYLKATEGAGKWKL